MQRCGHSSPHGQVTMDMLGHLQAIPSPVPMAASRTKSFTAWPDIVSLLERGESPWRSCTQRKEAKAVAEVSHSSQGPRPPYICPTGCGYTCLCTGCRRDGGEPQDWPALATLYRDSTRRDRIRPVVRQRLNDAHGCPRVVAVVDG